MEITVILDRMIDKLARRAPLDDDDRAALHALPFSLRTVRPGEYLVHEGSKPESSCLILKGYAFRQKQTDDGGRQIVSLHLSGDFVDLQGALLTTADHSVQALTAGEIATVPVKAITDLIAERPAIARAMWVDTLVDASIHREWMLNVGRRAAPARIAHLLCEFARRLEVAELGTTGGYLFPMTQEQLTDATGLTPVHVNRTLKLLDDDALITREKRFVGIPNWPRLRAIAGFNEAYLHLGPVTPVDDDPLPACQAKPA